MDMTSFSFPFKTRAHFNIILISIDPPEHFSKLSAESEIIFHRVERRLIKVFLLFLVETQTIQERKRREMVSILLPFLVFLIGSAMSLMPNDLTYSKSFQRISRQHHPEQPNRAFRNIMGKLFDTETNTIYNLDGQKHQGTPINPTGSMSVGPSTRFMEDLACLEACYKCVEDYPLTAVSSLPFPSVN